MKELIGAEVKILLLDTHGFVSMQGRVLDVDQLYILLETTRGNVYVAHQAVKTIQIKADDQHAE
ncbi:MAG: hypothetical protein ACNA7K_04170 [Acholeplasmataceae bacterium]